MVMCSERVPTNTFRCNDERRLRRDDEVGRTAEPRPRRTARRHRVLDEGYEWSSDNQAEIDKGWILKADTLAELAEKLGLDPTVVETSVRRYNEACADGIDHSFGRNPETLAPVATAPFYAVSGSPLLGWSSGGPRRDGHSRVLDTARNPIPGLYAAGAVSSTYSAAKDGGFHIADAFAFGRVAGAHAAARKA